jgi:RNA polymerase sigma factor (sigma-70 family)
LNHDYRGACSDILSELSDARERINGLRAEARELRLRATRTTTRTDEPSSGSRKRHGAPSSWDKLAEVEERLQAEERRRDELEQEAADAFEQLDSVRKTQILRLRWLYGLPLEQIADRLCWSESTIRHDAAEAMEDLKRLERSKHG